MSTWNRGTEKGKIDKGTREGLTIPRSVASTCVAVTTERNKEGECGGEEATSLGWEKSPQQPATKGPPPSLPQSSGGRKGDQF